MFTEQERRIFQYFNGVEKVYGDPLDINRRINHYLGGDPNAVIRQCQSPEDKIAFDATNRLVAGVQQAFDMVPFDKTAGVGALFQDYMDAWNAFCNFLEEKKTEPGSLPTSAPPMEESAYYPNGLAMAESDTTSLPV